MNILSAVSTSMRFTLFFFLLLRPPPRSTLFPYTRSSDLGLRRTDGKSQLPPVTPLLQRGDHRYAEQRFDGVLPGGVHGSLCLYTYEEDRKSTRLNSSH